MLGHGVIVLAGKLLIALLGGGLMVALVLSARPRTLETRRFDALAVALVAASRLALFIVVYLVRGESVTSDVGDFYYAEGRAILDGAVLYRDVTTSYAPLFPFILAGVLSLWDTAKAIVLFAIVLEVLSVPLWLRVGRQHFEEPVVRGAALLYAAAPVPLVNVALNGQNQVWISLLLAISLLALARRDTVSGIAQGVVLVAVKLLGLLYVPVLWLFARRRTMWTIGFVAPIVVVYGACLAAGLTWDELLVPIRIQGDLMTAGNLGYFLSIIGLDPRAPSLQRATTVLTMLGLAAVFLVSWRRGAAQRPANVIHLLTLVLITLLFLFKKSYPSYLVMSFFTICLSLAAGGLAPRTIVAFAIFSGAAVLESSLYFRWVKPHGLDLLWRAELPEGLVRWRVAVFAICELVLLASYVWLFQRTWRQLEFTARTPRSKA